MLGRWVLKLFVALHVGVYRLTGGAIGGQTRGLPVLLLTTSGRKSRRQRTVPLLYFRDGAGYVITASNGGADRHPAWFLNLQSNPQARVKVAGFLKQVVAEQANPAEKQRLWGQLVAQAPFYEEYQKRTRREIPMVILRPVS